MAPSTENISYPTYYSCFSKPKPRGKPVRNPSEDGNGIPSQSPSKSKLLPANEGLNGPRILNSVYTSSYIKHRTVQCEDLVRYHPAVNIITSGFIPEVE